MNSNLTSSGNLRDAVSFNIDEPQASSNAPLTSTTQQTSPMMHINSCYFPTTGENILNQNSSSNNFY